MFVGSADAVRSEWADVIVANIDAATLELIAPELERVRKPRVDSDSFRIPGVGHSRRISPAEILSLEEWRCFICTAKDKH